MHRDLILSFIKKIIIVVIIKNLLMNAYVTTIAMTAVVFLTARFTPHLLFSFISPCFYNSENKVIIIANTHTKLGSPYSKHFLDTRKSQVSLLLVCFPMRTKLFMAPKMRNSLASLLSRLFRKPNCCRGYISA